MYFTDLTFIVVIQPGVFDIHLDLNDDRIAETEA